MIRIFCMILMSIFICPVFSDGLNDVNLYPLKISGKYGFIDTSGKLIIEPNFEKAENFSDGLALIKQNDKLGFINTKGQVVFYVNAQNARSFSNGAVAIQQNRQWGFMDKNGQVIIQPQFLNVRDFFDGMTAVQRTFSDNYIFINKKGDTIFPDKSFAIVYTAANGYMVAGKRIHDNFTETVNIDGRDRMVTVSGIRRGVIDASGVTVIPFEYSFFSTKVSDDAINFGIMEEDTRRSRWGVINLSNTVIIPPIFYHVGGFYKGIAPASKDGEKFGIIDKEGNYILDEQYELIQSFQSDRAVFQQNGLFGFLDTTGKVVIAAQFDFAKSFEGELAFIRKNGIEGYVTKSGVIYLSSSY